VPARSIRRESASSLCAASRDYHPRFVNGEMKQAQVNAEIISFITLNFPRYLTIFLFSTQRFVVKLFYLVSFQYFLSVLSCYFYVFIDYKNHWYHVPTLTLAELE
jgi:hypothetical protein